MLYTTHVILLLNVIDNIIFIIIAPLVCPCTIGCYSGGDIAIAVVVYTPIECLLAAPVITAVMVFCWKRNQRYVYLFILAIKMFIIEASYIMKV